MHIIIIYVMCYSLIVQSSYLFSRIFTFSNTLKFLKSLISVNYHNYENYKLQITIIVTSDEVESYIQSPYPTSFSFKTISWFNFIRRNFWKLQKLELHPSAVAFQNINFLARSLYFSVYTGTRKLRQSIFKQRLLGKWHKIKPGSFYKR